MSPLIKRLESSSDDPQILEILKSVTIQLGTSAFRVKGVQWLNFAGGGKSPNPVFSDIPIFKYHSLIIAKDMMGKLSPEDWRPLIASSVVYQTKMFPKLRLFAVEIIGIPFLLAIGVSFALLDLTHSGLAAAPFMFIGLASIFFGLSRYRKQDDKARLQADLEAAKVVGKESLLDTLHKIQGLGMSNLEKRGAPSINDRITNLEKEQ